MKICRLTRTHLFLLYLLIIFAIDGCKKQNGDTTISLEPGKITGVVRNPGGQPLPMVYVKLTGDATAYSYTNNFGSYLFSKVNQGNYVIQFTLHNFITQTEQISIKSPDTVKINMVLQPGPVYLHLSDSVLTIPSSPTTKKIIILSNSGWTVSCNTGWLAFNPASGYGNGSLSMVCQSNTSTSIRSCSIVLNDGQHDHIILIRQGFGILLMGATFTLADGISAEQDSVTLAFNQPVKVLQLPAGFQKAANDLYWRYLGDSSSIRFNYNGARLGTDPEINYRVSDRIGNESGGTAILHYYTDKIFLPGKISDLHITEDNNTLWAALQAPGRLVEVSMITHQVIRTISLPFYPARICMNPWDQKLYLNATAPYYNRYDSTIYVIDPVSGNTDRTIKVRRDSYDHPQYPEIFPHAMQFTSSGYGAILLFSHGASGQRWKILDCAHSDSIYIHPDWFNVNDYHDFSDVYMSSDKETLLMISNRNTGKIAELSSITHAFIDRVPPVISFDYFIRPNRLFGDIWLGQSNEQYILYPSQTMSNMTHFALQNSSGADFSYRPSKPHEVYVSVDDQLQLIDYISGNPVLIKNLQYNVIGPYCPTDGKQVVMARCSDYNSDILFFDTDIFRLNKK